MRRLFGLLLGAALFAWGCGVTPSPTPVPSIPGTVGHFDDGQEAFDYPLDWNVLAGGQPSAGGIEYIIAVLGDGTADQGRAARGQLQVGRSFASHGLLVEFGRLTRGSPRSRRIPLRCAA
jgi:hypothetical protein